MSLNRTQRGLIAVVVAGAVVIAGIGFAGSYSAVRDLAIRKGFGSFASVFPIGVDAGIAVLLSLDLLLTWLRIPFPMLRQAAWLLTAATIGFNAAAAWPDPIGVGMHSVIPILFVVTVEAARHAVGRLAAITADRHMEGVRLWRWLLAPLPTFRLWRRMMLWEIRRYDDVIQAEQQRLVYQARLRGRYGRGWRWKAPVEELLPLRIARYGVPLEASPHQRAREPEEDAAGIYSLERGATPQRTRPGRDELAHHERPAPADQSPAAQALHAKRERTEHSRHEKTSDSEAGPEGEGWHGEVILETLKTETRGAHDPHTQAEGDREADPPLNPSDLEAKPDEDDLDNKPVDGAALGEDSTDGSVDEYAREVREERVPDTPGEGAARRMSSAEHETALARVKSNAAAVRYAMRVLSSTHTPTVVEWLAAHGREVNRGQAHRITKEEAERQQSGRHLTAARGGS
ncbi:DUF2637 domain-containing protein [Streptomyces scabiei]|uniref:DUF2637 domain-containing protein n=1 Tax=Streptomyces scabiei TaxID=1930 RepID=UPI0007C825A7|nr:DUF2637 domain-containing protein [Streptomyces scabiei]